MLRSAPAPYLCVVVNSLLVMYSLGASRRDLTMTFSLT